jgi:hypothetical protein
MTRDEHVARHRELHQRFDELLADYLRHDRTHSIRNTIEDLMRWSHEQTQPATLEHDHVDDYSHGGEA